MSTKGNVSCREAVEQLWAYLDGELAADQEHSVHEHLGACASCYPHYDFQKAFRQFLKSHAGQSVPAGLRRRIFLRLLAEEARAGDASGI